MNSKKEHRLNSAVYYIIVAVVILFLFLLLVIIFGDGKSNTVEVSGGGKTIGLRCTDSEVLHPALRDYAPISHTNTIMANFTEEDVLSSITLYYVGVYSSPEEARQADAYAQADYGLILAKEYGVNVNTFSHSFTTDGSKVNMTITAKSDNISDKTAPYFLLERDKSFPKSLEGMKKRYEGINFTCEVIE